MSTNFHFVLTSLFFKYFQTFCICICLYFQCPYGQHECYNFLHNYDDLVKSSPQIYCLIHGHFISGFNPLPFSILNVIHYQQCNHNRGAHVNYAQWRSSLMIWMRHIHIMWCTPMFIEKFKCETENENNRRIRSWGMFLNS